MTLAQDLPSSRTRAGTPGGKPHQQLQQLAIADVSSEGTPLDNRKSKERLQKEKVVATAKAKAATAKAQKFNT